jgi:iron complex outermembrane recepter protein
MSGYRIRQRDIAVSPASTCTALSVLALCAALAPARAQTATPAPVAGPTIVLPEIDVDRRREANTAFAQQAHTGAEKVDLGPLGDRPIKDTPTSVTVVPKDVLVNQQTTQVNDVLQFLPSVEIRDQQGYSISRPQARGFQSSIAENTRVDGLNAIGTTAIPVENLSAIEVLNGPEGALFGPETPAGTFDYILARPTDTPLFRTIESFDSRGVFTEWIDAGGKSSDGKIGYRLNLVHGQGEEQVESSYLNRTLGSLALDYHIDNQTVIETNYSHYATDSTGLPGSIVYNGASTSKTNTNTQLPNGLNFTTPGLGQPGSGTNLRSDTGVVKLKHDFNPDWHLEIGGLYENAVRNLYGITNTLVNNAGNYTVTKNFTAVPRFTIASNEAYLNGRVDLFGFRNDVTLGTNGFVQNMYSYASLQTPVLGSSTLANPTIFPQIGPPTSFGGQYNSGYQSEQSIITGDTLHLNQFVALQGILNTSFLETKSFANREVLTSADSENGVLSPTASLIVTPTKRLTTYFTYSSSVEPGDTAPVGTANANQILAPYHDELYEVGAKYQLFSNLLVTLDGFRMTRPYAFTQTGTNDYNVFAVGGEQRNYGVELFGQGAITPELSVLGGATWLDARLQNSGVAATNDKLIVGVPHWKTDILVDYHPFMFHGGALTAAVHQEDARAAVNTNTSYASGFVTLDLGARYSTAWLTHHATLRFQVVNVTNESYYESVADGNIVGSPGANTAYLGMPRTYQASLEVDF